MVRVRGQANVAAVENRGRFLRLAEPGINFFNPCAGELVARTLSTRVPSLETKTKFFRGFNGRNFVMGPLFWIQRRKSTLILNTMKKTFKNSILWWSTNISRIMSLFS
ncbi:uncharacterized protein [Aegilops tauschii subsp. strangulata]